MRKMFTKTRSDLLLEMCRCCGELSHKATAEEKEYLIRVMNQKIENVYALCDKIRKALES